MGRCCDDKPSLRWLWGCPLSIFGLIIVLPLMLIYAVLNIPVKVIGWLVHKMMANLMPLLVEFPYMIGCIGRRHVNIARFLQRMNDENKYHSRWKDMRVETEGAYIHAIPNLNDNYCYLVVDHNLNAVLIDVGDSKRILAAIPAIEDLFYEKKSLNIQAILTTHKHWDHSAGNAAVVEHIPSIKHVYCGEKCTPPHKLKIINDGSTITIGKLNFYVMCTPCHTRGHCVFMLGRGKEKQCLFTGDTLFAGGCGALFEGTETEMLRNFFKIRQTCRKDCLLFPGHEAADTLLDQAFNQGRWGGVSPGIFHTITHALYKCHHRRQLDEKIPTIPILLEEEMATNPNFYQVEYAMNQIRRAVVPEQLRDSQAQKYPDTTHTTTHEHYQKPFQLIERNDWNAVKQKLISLSDQVTQQSKKGSKDTATTDDTEIRNRNLPDRDLSSRMSETHKIRKVLETIENKQFQDVEEQFKPYHCKVYSLEQSLRICGGTKIISKDDLLVVLENNSVAKEEIERIYMKQQTFTPWELQSILSQKVETGLVERISSLFIAAGKRTSELVKLSEDSDNSSSMEKILCHDENSHNILACSYCNSLLDYGHKDPFRHILPDPSIPSKGAPAANAKKKDSGFLQIPSSRPSYDDDDTSSVVLSLGSDIDELGNVVPRVSFEPTAIKATPVHQRPSRAEDADQRRPSRAEDIDPNPVLQVPRRVDPSNVSARISYDISRESIATVMRTDSVSETQTVFPVGRDTVQTTKTIIKVPPKYSPISVE